MLSGNPLAMAAGIATVSRLRRDRAKIYPALERNSSTLVNAITEIAQEGGVDVTSTRVGSMFTWFFRTGNVYDYEDAAKSDTAKFAQFHRGMLDRGIYLPPSQFEAVFLSMAHTSTMIGQTIEASRSTFKCFKQAAVTSPS